MIPAIDRPFGEVFPTQEQRRAKRSAALTSLAAATVITTLKLVAGLLTGSLGMLSEAAHSGIDLVAAAITLFSVQVADRPADDDHNYGHGKIESLSAFVETGLMLISSVWIVYESIHRILYRNSLELAVSVWPFLVLLLSIGLDWSRARNLRKVAEEYRSDALKADAVHFGTDIWSSIAVLIGLTATAAGEHFHVRALELADPVAALVVAGIIFKVTYHLARETAETLLDATPAQDGQTAAATRRKLIGSLRAIDGVLAVDRLRTRRSGSGYFADVTLAMPRNLTFQRSEQITFAATEAIQNVLAGADVVVHSVPTVDLAESVHDRVRAAAARANLQIHDVSVQEYRGKLHLELHLELAESMPLRVAHEVVTRLEASIRAEVPSIGSVVTHMESEPATIERPASLEQDRRLEETLRSVTDSFPEVLDLHDVVVTKHHDRVHVTCHCTLPDELPMGRVHEVITAVENAFRLAAPPEVSRLLIHPEPATDNRR